MIAGEIALFTATLDSTIGELADGVFQIGSLDLRGEVRGVPTGTEFEPSNQWLFDPAAIRSIAFPRHLGKGVAEAEEQRCERDAHL